MDHIVFSNEVLKHIEAKKNANDTSKDGNTPASNGSSSPLTSSMIQIVEEDDGWQSIESRGKVPSQSSSSSTPIVESPPQIRSRPFLFSQLPSSRRISPSIHAPLSPPSPPTASSSSSFGSGTQQSIHFTRSAASLPAIPAISRRVPPPLSASSSSALVVEPVEAEPATLELTAISLEENRRKREEQKQACGLVSTMIKEVQSIISEDQELFNSLRSRISRRCSNIQAELEAIVSSQQSPESPESVKQEAASRSQLLSSIASESSSDPSGLQQKKSKQFNGKHSAQFDSVGLNLVEEVMRLSTASLSESEGESEGESDSSASSSSSIASSLFSSSILDEIPSSSSISSSSASPISINHSFRQQQQQQQQQSEPMKQSFHRHRPASSSPSPTVLDEIMQKFREIVEKSVEKFKGLFGMSEADEDSDVEVEYVNPLEDEKSSDSKNGKGEEKKSKDKRKKKQRSSKSKSSSTSASSTENKPLSAEEREKLKSQATADLLTFVAVALITGGVFHSSLLTHGSKSLASYFAEALSEMMTSAAVSQIHLSSKRH